VTQEGDGALMANVSMISLDPQHSGRNCHFLTIFHLSIDVLVLMRICYIGLCGARQLESCSPWL